MFLLFLHLNLVKRFIISTRKYITMKIVYIAISLLALNVSISRAQQSSLTIGLGKPLTTHSVTDVSGSPFLTDSFQNSDVTTPGGHKLSNVPLRYNVYDQTIEYMVNSQIYDVTDSITRFSFTDSLTRINTFIKPVFLSKNGKTFYYKILVEGNSSLLKSYAAEITTEEDWYTKKITKKYVTKSEYFLLADNKVTKLGTNKRSFIEAFNNDPKVKVQLDKQAPDFKNETSLIHFFEGLN